MFAVLPVTVATVSKVTLSVLTLSVKSWVFHWADSPPAPAWETMILSIDCALPRSTCHHLSLLVLSHHLSPLPPLMEPFTALDGFSLALHEALAVASWLSARLVDDEAAPKTSTS